MNSAPRTPPVPLEDATGLADTIFATAQTVMVVLDTQGRIVRINPYMERLSGYRQDEVQGRDWFTTFLPPREQENIRALFLAAVHDIQTQGNINAIVTKTGSERLIEWYDKTIKDARGRALGLLSTGQDVTERQAMETARRQEAARFRGLFENMIEGVALHELVRDGHGAVVDYRILDVNPAYEKNTGLSVAQTRGTLASALYGATPPPYLEVYARVAETGVPCVFETYFPPLRRHYNISAFSPGPGQFATVFEDITQRKRADQALQDNAQRLTEAQQLAHIGNWELNLADQRLTWSDEIFRIFELDPERFGASYEAFLGAIHPDDRDLVNRAYTESVATHQPHSLVHRLRMPDGRIKFVHERGQTFYDEQGTALRSAGTIQDVTERVKAEEEVRRLNAELEQRVRDRTAQLATANQELEAFSYSISHDLRAPLRHLQGYVRLLLERPPASMDDQQRHFLDVIAGAAVQMGRLIDDILAFSRMGRADLMRMRVSMDQLVREARESLQAELQGRAVTWRSGPLPDVQGDAAMLKTVLVNLLANAIKFTRGQPDAVIEIGHQPAADGSPVFFVKDNGAGFDMRYADKLFGLFQRLHRVDEFEGTGVGLASVRRIIQRHGGQAWAEGAAGRGATFYFSLPARPGA